MRRDKHDVCEDMSVNREDDGVRVERRERG